MVPKPLLRRSLLAATVAAALACDAIVGLKEPSTSAETDGATDASSVAPEDGGANDAGFDSRAARFVDAA